MSIGYAPNEIGSDWVSSDDPYLDLAVFDSKKNARRLREFVQPTPPSSSNIFQIPENLS